MERVRVLRILEYEYESMDYMDKDMGRWNLAANGFKSTGSMVVRSITMFPHPLEEQEQDEPPGPAEAYDEAGA